MLLDFVVFMISLTIIVHILFMLDLL